MKLFSWMQSKFSDKRGYALPSIDQKNKELPKEELQDWPNGLLAIGTFGHINHTTRDESQLVERNLNTETEIPREEECSSPDFSEFIIEEVRSLQKELTKLMGKKSSYPPLDKFLNCPSSSELDLDPQNKDEEDIDRTIRVILGRCKHAKNRAMKKKSLSILIKKMFLCGSEFSSRPNLGDAFQESRMEKLMKAMLTKEFCPISLTKKCMKEYKPSQIEENEKNRDRSKWDKTGCEFIVLEILPKGIHCSEVSK